MIKCIIIDDHESAIKIIESHLKNFLDFNLVATFTEPIIALEYLENNETNLVFVDVDMPNLSGLELIESLRLKKGLHIPHFIVITGFSEHAVQGFEQGVVDYLIKPITFKRFKISLDRYLINFIRKETIDTKYLDFFFVEVEGKRTRINYNDLVYLESNYNYVSLFLIEKGKIRIYRPLIEIEEMLNPNLFIRVHKSFIVSIKSIEIVENIDIQVNYNHFKVSIPLGRKYKDALKLRLKIN